ncbi:shK domain-like domain-containing protein [Ditylenchus destructor]|nr:shK domain-like domain-containing protein [Ditylenchus destructor]
MNHCPKTCKLCGDEEENTESTGEDEEGDTNETGSSEESATESSSLTSEEGNSISAENLNCVDRGTDCERAKFLCNKKEFSALMSQECAKTCGRCFSNQKSEQTEEKSSTEKCQDNYRRCPIWKTIGFCTSNSYTDSIKRRYCSKSCGLC